MTNASSNSMFQLPELRRSVYLAALMVGASFFITEHNLFTSQANDFTQTAEEMLATAEGGNMLRRLAFLALAACGAGLFVASKKTPFRQPTLGGGLLLAMIMLAFASVLWARDQGLCVRRLLAFGLSLAGMFGVARRFDLKELCFIALGTSLTCVVIGVGCEIALGTFRPWSADYRFSGTVHPNTQGTYLATMCFAALSLSIADAPRRTWYWMFLAAGIVLLVLTKSRTSTIGVLASLGVVGWMLCSHRVRVIVPLAALILAASGLLLLLLFGGSHTEALPSKIILLGREDQVESFSGRTTIWPVLQEYIDKRFWLGYGFESFWTPTAIEEVTAECQWPVREAHSSYRELLLSLGAIGLATYLSLTLAGIASAVGEYRTTRDACALFCFGMILNGLFNGLFESGMALVSLPTFMIAAGVVRLALFHAPAHRSAAEELWQPRPRLSFVGTSL